MLRSGQFSWTGSLLTETPIETCTSSRTIGRAYAPIRSIEPAADSQSGRGAERVAVGVVLVGQALHLLHFSHELVFPYETRLGIHSPADAARMFLPDGGLLYAPDAYRVGIPALGRAGVALTQTVHPSWVAAGIDTGFFLLAGFVFYHVVIEGWEHEAGPRRLATALFLLLIQFPLQWVLPWHRSETMAVAAYLAVALWSVQRSGTFRFWWLLLLGATALQATVRTDVPLVFGISLAVAAATKLGRSPATRRAMLAGGAAVAALALGGQLLLQGVVFPHLSYPPGVPKIQLGYNLHGHNLAVLAVALFPFAAFFALRSRRWPAADSLTKVVCLSAALYLLLWFVVGIFAEVRLYVPFLFALSAIVARGTARHFAAESVHES